MADINKSVSVKFDADVSKLLNDVKGLSGLSEKEAKAVGDALSKNMKAAGKSAEVAARKTQTSMKKMEKSSKQADRAFKQLKRRSSEIGRGFGELSMIIGETDTPMGNMINNISGISLTAGALIPLFGSLRGAMVALGTSTAMATGGLTIAAGALLLLITNMQGVDEEAKTQQKQIDRLGKTYRKLNDKIQKSIDKNAAFRESLEDTVFRIDALDREMREKKLRLDFEMGKLPRSEFEAFLIESEVSAENEKIEKSFELRAAALKKSITGETNTINDMRHALNLLETQQVQLQKAGAFVGMVDADVTKINQFVEAATSQSAIEKFINQTFHARSRIFKDNLRAYATQVQLQKAAVEAEKKFTEEREKEENRIKDLARATVEGEVKLDKQRQATAATTKENQDNERDNEARIAEIEKQRLSIKTQMQKLDFDNLNADQQKIAAVNRQIDQLYELISANAAIATNDDELIDAQKLLNGLLEKRTQIQKDIDAAAKQQTITEQTEDEIALYRELFDMQKLGYEELRDMRFKFEDSFLEHEQKIHKEVLRMIDERNKKTKEGIQQTIGLMGSFGSATIQTLDNMGIKNQELVNNLFMLQRAASISQIAFTTAENITKAQGYPAPLNAIATGLAVATGVAQTAAVMSQPAPSVKKHMGGTIGPDERNYTLLRGEAVLDRQTVRNLGGAEGVRRLQQNRQQPEVIVLQPFKHFDRFLKSRNRNNGKPIKQGY